MHTHTLFVWLLMQVLATYKFYAQIVLFLFLLDGVALFLVPSVVLWSSGNALRLTVHSRNDKGVSDRIMLQALTYQDPERRTGTD